MLWQTVGSFLFVKSCATCFINISSFSLTVIPWCKDYFSYFINYKSVFIEIKWFYRVHLTSLYKNQDMFRPSLLRNPISIKAIVVKRTLIYFILLFLFCLTFSKIQGSFLPLCWELATCHCSGNHMWFWGSRACNTIML